MELKPLWNHQVHGIRVAEKMPDLGLLYEQGTGKTRTMVEILRRRYAKAGRLQKTLIVCPLIVCENWKQEFKKFSKINMTDIVILTKTGYQREQHLLDIIAEGKGKIIITNYESMQMSKVVRLLQLWHPELLVCDESQRLKNPGSVRAKAVVSLAELSAQNFILTGTPILNSAMDVFMQFRVLDRGNTFGKNFYAFRGQYFHDANARFRGKQNYFPKWEMTPEAAAILQDKVATKALRVLKKDCLDLPPFVRQEVQCGLSKDQATAYRQMMNEYITFIKSKHGEPKAVVAQLAVTKALRLQQIVTGFAKDEEGTTHRLECPRTKVLAELLEDIAHDHKVIVWAVFKENYKQIAEVCAELKLGYVELHGDVPQGVRNQNLDSFRSDPSVRVMIANQGAGGVGINMVEASYAIYYSKGFKLEDDLQSEARNYRGGSEMHEKITRIDIICKGTIDELVNEALAGKQNIANQILDWKLPEV